MIIDTLIERYYLLVAYIHSKTINVLIIPIMFTRSKTKNSLYSQKLFTLTKPVFFMFSRATYVSMI